MSKQPKNVLFLFSDQLRHDALGYAGHPFVKTPNLDRLASQSVNFRNAFTPTPLCVPARHSLATGLRNGRHRRPRLAPIPGVAPELPTFMSAMHQSGYATHAVGKTHFHGRNYGFENIERMEECVDCLLEDDYVRYLRAEGVRTRFQHGMRDLLYFQPQTLPTPVEHSPDEWVADRSIAFLRDHARYASERPFLLFTSFIDPHPPFAAPEPYASMYDPADIPLPLNRDRPMGELGYGALVHRGRLDGAHEDPDRMRRIMALYFGLVSQVDACVGRVLDELERLGLGEDTVILMSSDHGDMLGDQGLSQKNVPFDPSARVPLLVRWPGKSRDGLIDDGFASLLDIFPTLSEGLGLKAQDTASELAGQSLMARLAGEGGAPGQFVVDYGHREDRWLSLVTRDYKYNYWFAEGFEELYDLSADPGESVNLLLSGSRDMRVRADRMKAQMTEWERRFGFPEDMAEGELPVFSVPSRPTTEAALRRVEFNQGKWADRLPQEEAHLVDDIPTAIKRALAKETTVTRQSISVEIFEKNGGCLDGTPLARTPTK